MLEMFGVRRQATLYSHLQYGFSPYKSPWVMCFGILAVIVQKKPFAKMLLNCLVFVSWLVIIASFISPHITGVENIFNYHILKLPNFSINDGNMLFVGVLLLVIASIFKYGISYQQVNDELV
ncbi:putative membrane protein [Lachnospiraceae bacterium PF1-21]